MKGNKMSKKLFFGTNLKMYKNIKETTSYLQELVDNTKDISRKEIELFVIPSFTALSNAVSCIDSQYVKIGAQNMHWKNEGQFTGEISPLMLKELDVGLVMVGHSERRHIFGETDVEENQKVRAALKNRFTVLLCVGETEEEKRLGISNEILQMQLKIGLNGVRCKDIPNVWVAYEPVWSIGVNGTPAEPEYAEGKHKKIKEELVKIFGESGKGIPVLYGGSVNPGNANQLIVQKSIDGLFVGRSAWKAEEFNNLIRNAKIAYDNNC